MDSLFTPNILICYIYEILHMILNLEPNLTFEDNLILMTLKVKYKNIA